MITLTTDIGWEYAAQMKGVILSINPKVRIVDISHSITPQNILEGAFVLYTAIPRFPKAIHIAIVDPGVGTERRGLIVVCKNSILVGPDNGLLIPCANKLGLKKVCWITNKKYCLKKISNIFHGRDIFAPVAAYLSLGIKPSEIGIQIKDYKKLDFGEPKETREKIEGKIIFIDRFGNLITNIPSEKITKIFKYGDRIQLRINNKTLTPKFLRSYGYSKEHEILATISSSDLLEVSYNKGRANDVLGIAINDKITLLKK
ncbi:MAG: S-adenosyl-l-methionine hydroxide adenosyltransferase family protein [Candidatus Thermoplasmatota archaeon]|nr:S-adenosyl-l-methionine hydroxide adenosyltransferase family protein [Candidatus Thermoplasmatota archaeon]MDI6855679.1 S-adenosyl-l-methionine hydroxide adenosyltransferase family protein [Candidatus Thermoplasmatota archaeon]